MTAAFLHDLGHLLNLQGETPTRAAIDDQHQYFAIPFLRPAVPARRCSSAIRLHVDAKRALCALEPGLLRERCRRTRSAASRCRAACSRRAQAEHFLRQPYAEDAMRVRRWDDAAKVPGMPTPGLAHFEAILRTVARRAP